MRHLNYWQCSKCHGTGKVIPVYAKNVEECEACDGTGNALVNGEAERHRRRISELTEQTP